MDNNTIITKAREILNKLCEMGCCDRELDDPVCDDRQTEFLAATLTEWGDAKYKEGFKDGEFAHCDKNDAEGYRRGMEDVAKAGCPYCRENIPLADGWFGGHVNLKACETTWVRSMIRALLPSEGKEGK